MKHKKRFGLIVLMAASLAIVLGYMHFKTQNILGEIPTLQPNQGGSETSVVASSSPYTLKLHNANLEGLTVKRAYYGEEQQTYKICMLAGKDLFQGLPSGIDFFLDGKGPLDYTFYYETIYFRQYLVFILPDHPEKQTVQITFRGKTCTASFDHEIGKGRERSLPFLHDRFLPRRFCARQRFRFGTSLQILNDGNASGYRPNLHRRGGPALCAKVSA